MSILVTGAAGFIGFHACKRLLERGNEVIGIDNFNAYYDVSLKEARCNQLLQHPNFKMKRIDIADKDTMFNEFEENENITKVLHLAAQAGVRYSFINPYEYIKSNVMGQVVLLELCKTFSKLDHFIYASSSSVYGGNKKQPFSEIDKVDHPVSLYAATKKADELISHVYSELNSIKMTGLRFFTVYGPWGRPDMSAYIFTKAIFEGQPIDLFNHGKMKRDFTFIDDVVDGVLEIIDSNKDIDIEGTDDNYNIYNIGNNRPEDVSRFISILEELIGKKAIIRLAPMQPGDVVSTFADIAKIKNKFDFSPKTSIESGLFKFVDWYKNYHNLG
tara:strand:+ start:29074 stop:30063 length:990 start_codon:yes stop_codon:yes gene_type:complete